MASEPRFLLASATIANPVELAERLVGEPFEPIADDGAPRTGREIAMWNPPLIDRATGTRRSPLSEAAEMLVELVSQGVRTICFLKSRRGIELIQRFAREGLEARGKPELAERIAPYRGGYTPQQRREIEARLSAGELLAVVATDALELGIDIGELDAAICVTFPGTVASLRQMWGRAGRRRRGLAVYVAGQDALDQFFCRHPDEFIDRPVEAAILDHESEQIASRHLLAAAYELPLSSRGRRDLRSRVGASGPRGWPAPASCAGRAPGSCRAAASSSPSKIPLRSASADSVAVIERDSGEMLGLVEAERAFTTIHPGAVYLHLGRSYEVERLDIDGRRAIVSSFDGDWYTRPKKETEIYIERVREQRTTAGVELHFGEVSVSEQVIAFQRVSISDQEPIDVVALELPEQHFVTQALWYVLPDRLSGALPPDVLLGALHATEHGQIAVLPLIAMCDRWDIGGLSTNVHFQTGRSTIFIYDGHPGGVGITLRGYEQFERLLDDAERLIAECPCESGCPSCVQSPKCGNLNEPLHKEGALELMRTMRGRSEEHGRPQRGRFGPIPAPRSARVRFPSSAPVVAPRIPSLWRLAEEVGRLLAEAGATVVCGGRGGVMEAAARGAAGAGGEVIGIVPGVSIDEANPHCTHVVASGIGFARNLAVVASGDAVIAVGGAWGTLSEIGHARAFERTVVALDSWGLVSEEMEGAPGVVVVETAGRGGRRRARA